MNLQRLFAAPIALGLILGSTPTFNSPAQAATVKINIPKSAVATAFNSALASTKIRLDNYGSKRGTTWYKDSSYILFPNGSKKSIPIPEYKYKITSRRYLKHYVDDMNTSSIKTNINGNRINATAYFESQGHEIKGKCVRKKLNGKFVECSLNMQRDINLNNTRLSISLKPVAYNGSISYANPIVDFKTDVQIPNKLCKAFKSICGKIENKIKNELTNTVEGRTTYALNSSQVRGKVASSVKQAITSRMGNYKNWKVIKVTSQGNNFVLTLSK